MKKAFSMRRVLRQQLLRMFALLFLVVACALLYLSTFGFPAWLVQELVRRVELTNFALETGGARFDILHGVTLDDVKLYRKGIVGVPFVTTRRAVVSFDPVALFDREALPVRSVRLDSPVLRLTQLAGPDWETRPGPPRMASIHVELRNLNAFDMTLDSITGDLVIEHDGVRFDRMRAAYGIGEEQGDVKGALAYDREKREISGAIELTADPNTLLPAVRACQMRKTAELISRFVFHGQRPRYEIEFRKQLGEEYPLQVETSLWMKDFSYRGVDLLGADGRVKIVSSPTVRKIQAIQLLAVRREGIVKGSFSIDALTRKTVFDGMSTIDPKALFTMLGVFKGGAMDAWKFEGPVRMAAQGIADIANPHMLRLDGTVTGRRMGVGKMVADSCTFNMHMADMTNRISNIRGVLHEGSFTGEAFVVAPIRPETNVVFRADYVLNDANFESMCLTLSDEQKVEYRGRLKLKGDIAGMLGKRNLATLDGAGTVRIRDGRVFMLPVFGGLSKFLTRLIPGLDLVISQSQADVSFSIKGGVVSTDDATVEGNILSLAGSGTYRMTDGVLDFKVMLKLLKSDTLGGKVARFVLFPLSKLFEFRLKGTRAEPHWYPVNFSTDLLEKIGWKRKDAGADDDGSQSSSPGVDEEDE